jgi:hypothetical protein
MDHQPTEATEDTKPLRPLTLEDRVLKFIEGHNREIWIVIAIISAVVVWLV